MDTKAVMVQKILKALTDRWRTTVKPWTRKQSRPRVSPTMTLGDCAVMAGRSSHPRRSLADPAAASLAGLIGEFVSRWVTDVGVGHCQISGSNSNCVQSDSTARQQETTSQSGDLAESDGPRAWPPWLHLFF